MRRKMMDVLNEHAVVFVDGQTSVKEAACLMREKDVGALPVVEGGALQGIFTVNDVTCRVVAAGLDAGTTPVSAVMTADPDTIGPKTLALEALRLMQDGGYRHLPVVDAGQLLGLVSRRDFYGSEKARLDDETAIWELIA